MRRLAPRHCALFGGSLCVNLHSRHHIHEFFDCRSLKHLVTSVTYHGPESCFDPTRIRADYQNFSLSALIHISNKVFISAVILSEGAARAEGP